MADFLNRLPGVKCEIGTCCTDAVFREFIAVIPDNPALKQERRAIDIVLCRSHDEQFHLDGLVGIITAYGDEIAERQN